MNLYLFRCPSLVTCSHRRHFVLLLPANVRVGTRFGEARDVDGPLEWTVVYNDDQRTSARDLPMIALEPLQTRTTRTPLC